MDDSERPPAQIEPAAPRTAALPRAAFPIAAIALAAFFIAIQIARSVEPLAMDQGLFACFGKFIPRGFLPYRDLFDSKPPLFLYTYAIAFAIPGSPVTALWIFEGLWLAASMVAIGLLAARLWGRWCGLAASAFLFTGLWSPGWGGYWARAQAEELLALPMIGAAWFALAVPPRRGSAFWAGALTGIAGLYKIPAMGVALAWPLVWPSNGGRAEGTRAAALATAARRTAWMAAGIAAPWAIALGYFWWRGALADLWDGVYVYQKILADTNPPAWGLVIRRFFEKLVSEAPGLLLAAAIGGALLVIRRRREAWLVVGWVVTTLAAVVFQRRLFDYHFVVVVPALAIAGSYGAVALARAAVGERGRRRATACGALAVLAALGVRSALAWRTAYGPDAAALAGAIPRESFLARFDSGAFSPAAEEAVARILREKTQPGDAILVWGLSPGIYALADRRPATRYPFHQVLLTDVFLSQQIPGLEARRAEFLRRLEADPPAYIVIGLHDENGWEPEDSYSEMLRFEAFNAFVRGRYEPEVEMDRFLLCRRVEPAR